MTNENIKELPMNLTGLHLLLTYERNLACAHCFVWGSPWQRGTMTLEQIDEILDQAVDLGTITRIYFEGGEPFLYYATLVRAVQMAADRGFEAGIVSNGYWATSEADAIEWLKPFAGLIQDLSISNDLFHWSDKLAQHVKRARAAAERLDIPVGYISIAQPEAVAAAKAVGRLPEGSSGIMYRGRASEELAPRTALRPWDEFKVCPYENLRAPGRVHVDPFGYTHLCQGITMGNLFETPLRTLCTGYDPDRHPITGPLLTGGPVELVRRYGLTHERGYADACHLCFESRKQMRPKFPEVLAPDQMYGVGDLSKRTE